MPILKIQFYENRKNKFLLILEYPAKKVHNRTRLLALTLATHSFIFLLLSANNNPTWQYKFSVLFV
jgi:hypothetical protein